MKRPLVRIWLILSLLAALPAVAAKDDPVKRLPERYQKWLGEEVAWILTRSEREEFLALAGDPDRDAFIDRFWQIRDPQPLTRENEFRDEHHRRLEYVKRHFANDSARRGWQTDRGRVYILLGKPDDVERTVSANEVYPYEMWFYGNTARLGLPGQLRLVFYRPLGTGEYRLLNPVLEKDRMFPPSSQINLEDPVALQALLGPEVSQAIESVAPGYSANTSDEIVQELRSPRQIPERIRDRGLALHPEVRTRFSLERLPLVLKTMVVPAGDGTSRVHLGAELPPAEVSFQEAEKDRFLARVDVFGDVTDAQGLVVARVDEVATLSLGRAEIEKRKANAFAFEAVRSLIPGRYKVSLALQDYSRGKLGLAEGEVLVEPPPEPPALAPLVLAFRVEPARAEATAEPFTTAGYKVFPRPGNRFTPGETLYAFASLSEPRGGPPRDLEVTAKIEREGKVAFQATAKSDAATARDGVRPLLLSLPTGPLATGSYQVTLTALADGVSRATASVPLQLVATAAAPGLFVHTEHRDVPPEVENFNRGVQFLSRGDLVRAQQAFRAAIDHRPGFRPASVYLARVQLLAGHPADAEPLLDRVLAADPENYDALVTRGSLLLGRGDFAGAAAALRRALEVGTRTKELLNGLAEASAASQDLDTARKCLRESLELDPRQEAVRKRLKAIGG